LLLQALPKLVNPQLQELLASTVRSKQRGLEVASDWKQQGTGGEAVFLVAVLEIDGSVVCLRVVTAASSGGWRYQVTGSSKV
jgi:hypothetical protein